MHIDTVLIGTVMLIGIVTLWWEADAATTKLISLCQRLPQIIAVFVKL